MDYKEEALRKLDAEKEKTGLPQKAAAVLPHVAKTLAGFCRQDEEFAQAVCQTEKTLGDCCTKIMENVGSSISDIEVYERAVSFYFPGAGIRTEMTVDLTASVSSEPEAKKAGAIVLKLSDFL